MKFKFISYFLVILILISIFTGCSSNNNNQNNQTNAETKASDTQGPATEWYYQKDTSPVDITCFFRGRWWDGVIDKGNGWETSPVFNHIKEKTGVSFNYDVPAASETEILGTMIASGTYPDMITFSDRKSPYISQMKEAGLIYSITELAEKYAPTLFEKNLITKSMRTLHEDEKGVLWSYIGFECGDDGKNAYRDIGFAPTSGFNILYVRKDLLKAFGKDINTWEDYNNYLKFVHDNYSSDEVYPIQPSGQGACGWIFDAIGRHFLSKFGCHLSRTYVDTKDQKLEFILKDPHCKEYVKWLNGLYRGGILTDSLLSISGSSDNENLYAGKYASIISSTFTASNSVNTTLKANGKEDSIYVPIKNVLVSDEYGFQAEVAKDVGQSATVITKNCKKPDRAIRLLEYFLTEDGQVNGLLGVEGETWEMKDGKPVLKDEAAKLIASDLLAYAKKYKIIGSFSQFALNKNWAYYVDDYLTPKGELRDLHNSQLGPRLTEIWNYGFINITNSFDTGSEADVTNTRIQEALVNGIAKVIAAKTDDEFENSYNSLISELESLGLSDIEKVYTDTYLKNCNKLGIKPFEKLFESVPMN